MAPIIHCVRHAQGFHNLGSEFASLPDPILTPKGKEQCETLKKVHFADQSRLSLIAASPLRRTLHTAFLTFEPTLTSNSNANGNADNVVAVRQILAVPDAQETSNFPCDTGSDRDQLAAFVKEQGWPVDLSLVTDEWNDKSMNGPYSPQSKALAARARAARQLLRQKARELVAAGQPDAEIVLVTHGGYLHYFTNDWENAFANVGTGWSNCETRSYTFANLDGTGNDGADEDEAWLVETTASRQKRGLSHPMHDPETQKRLFIKTMEGWESQGQQRPDRLGETAATTSAQKGQDTQEPTPEVRVVA